MPTAEKIFCAKAASAARGRLAQCVGRGRCPHQRGRVRHDADNPRALPSPASSLAMGTPAAMEMSKWPGVMNGRISSSNSATWPGLTARMRTRAPRTTSTLEAVVLAPDWSSEGGSSRRQRVAGPYLCAVLTRPAETTPLARAAAILPPPRKPMVSLSAMPTVLAGCLLRRKDIIVKGTARQTATQPSTRRTDYSGNSSR